jgi:hypothetical protein
MARGRLLSAVAHKLRARSFETEIEKRSQITISRILSDFTQSGLERYDVDGMKKQLPQYDGDSGSMRISTPLWSDPLARSPEYRELETATRESSKSWKESGSSCRPKNRK